MEQKQFLNAMGFYPSSLPGTWCNVPRQVWAVEAGYAVPADLAQEDKLFNLNLIGLPEVLAEMLVLTYEDAAEAGFDRGVAYQKARMIDEREHVLAAAGFEKSPVWDNLWHLTEWHLWAVLNGTTLPDWMGEQVVYDLDKLPLSDFVGQLVSRTNKYAYDRGHEYGRLEGLKGSVEEILQALGFAQKLAGVWYSADYEFWVCLDGARPTEWYSEKDVVDMRGLPNLIKTLVERISEHANRQGYESGYLTGGVTPGCL